MSKASRQKEFEREFRKLIERHAPALVSALHAIIAKSPPTVVKILDFEIQSDWDTFPVNLFAMDNESPDEVYFKAPFSGGLLERAGALIPDGAIDQDSYESAGVATFESGARILAEWFGECWHTAGGASFKLPAYIHHHDRSSYYDLRKRRWVKDSDIWS